MKLSSLFIFVFIFMASSCKSQDFAIDQFVPKGYKIYDKKYADLNNDGQIDYVLITKATDPTKVVINRFDKEVDRNRRGLLILLKKKGSYLPVVQNYACFYSENEDGGVYYAPQLSISIANGNLLVQFEHGRYGSWQYTFRYQNLGFELIGYQSTLGGATVSSMTKIDFITKQRIESININEDPDEREVFEDRKTAIKIEQLLKLSEIEDFEALDLSVY